MSTTTATASNASSQRVRQAWRAFEQWQAPKRTEMQRQCNLSSTTPAKRREIEDKHYLTARGEWQRRLTSAGLKDEDWGTMTAAETKAVELALGGGGGTSPSTTIGLAEEVDNSMSLVPHASASSSAATSNASLLQPPPQIGSSFSTSSITSSISSYEFVSPSELVSDDDRDDDDDDGAQGFMFQVAVTTAEHDIRHQARRSASVSEDEALPPTSFNYGQSTSSASGSHYGYGLTSPTSSTSQWRPFDTPGYQHWSNSEASSRHPSANASPAQPPAKSFYTPVMSTIHPLTASSSTSSSSSSKPMAVATSSSGWAASALSSAATSGYAAVSSMSLFGSSPPEAGTTQASKPKAPSTSKHPSSSASASASASALVPVSTFSSSTNRGPSHTKSVSASNPTATSSAVVSASASSMAIVPRQASPPYIGPILSDSGEDDHDESASDVGSQYGPDDAEFEFKKFKTHTRIEKIIEFHREAAELEVRLVVEIERMRAAVDHLPRDAEKKLIEGHQAQMRALQQSKELERKRIVKEERKRRRHALTAASASSSTSSLSLALVPQWNPNQPQPHPSRTEKSRDTQWLNAYDHAGSNFEVAMPDGFEFEDEPAASYNNPRYQPSSSSSSPYPYDQAQAQAQFGHPYPDLPTPQGPYAGESFQQQQQQHNGQHWSPPAQTFSPHSSSASSSNNASPSSFWDSAPLHPAPTPNTNGGANPNGRNSASIQNNSLLRRPPTVGGRRPPSQSPQIARPRPMPAWNPQQLEYSAEEDEGGPDHYENQQEYDWAQEPGCAHDQAQGQGQGRGYEVYSPHGSSVEEPPAQWGGPAHGYHHGQQPQQQQQGFQQQPPASMYETFQMSTSSFNDDDKYGSAQGPGDFFGGGEMDPPIPDELMAAMNGYNYGQGHGEYSPNSREGAEMKAREEAVRREQQEFQARQQQQQARKGMPINTSRKNSDFGREDKKGMPASLKGGSGDALNSSTNTLHGGVMNKTPTTTSPLASFIPSKLNGLGFGSFWSGRGAEQPDGKQVKEEDEGLSEEEDEEEEEEEEEESVGGWFSSQPQKQAPAPPAKKAPPPPPAPAPAPAPTTAKGRKAAARAKAKAEEEEKAAAAAKAAEEAEAARRAAEAAKEKETRCAPPVPEKTTAGGKKQTKKQKQAAAKKGGNAKSEPAPLPAPAPAPVEETKKTWASPANAKESKQAAEPAKKGTSSLSSSALSTGSEGGWGEASSTPRPSAASIKAQAGWGDRAQQQQDVLGASGVLRKQAVMHQAQHKQEANGASTKANGGPVPTIDTSPLPDDVRASLWSRATSRPAATPVSAITPTAASTPTTANSGWKIGGSKARRGSDGAANPFEPSIPKNVSAKMSNGAPPARKARNGFSSAQKKVTIEEVSDEEADMSADGSLGVESRYLLESAEEVQRQQEIAHPRPSMPPSSYNNFFGNDHYDEGFTSSANSSYVPQTPSTAPTSPPDDVPPMSNEELFSSATKNAKLQKALNGQAGGHSSSASGFASDWDATVKQKRPRWSTTTSGTRPASSATVGPGAGGPAQSAFRYKSSLAPPPMAPPMSSSESDDFTSPMGAIPGGSPTAPRGNVAGSGAGGNGSLMSAREQMRAAAAAGGGRAMTSNGPSTFGAGGRQAVETSSADNALLERFMQGQRQEEMKRATGKLF